MYCNKVKLKDFVITEYIIEEADIDPIINSLYNYLIDNEDLPSSLSVYLFCTNTQEQKLVKINTELYIDKLKEFIKMDKSLTKKQRKYYISILNSKDEFKF